LATFILLVMTVMLECWISACATASVVVPRFRIRLELSGIAAAQAAPMAALASECRRRRASYPRLTMPHARHRPAMNAVQQPGLGQIAQIAADGLQGHVETLRQILDHDAALGAGQFHDLILPDAERHVSPCSPAVKVTQGVDLFIIGGGINGCGIARDAVGRGLSVTLAEMGDLAQGTSSASTKLFHGGLRYLEYFEFRLVREALEERETLLTPCPISAGRCASCCPIRPICGLKATRRPRACWGW
jgi:hypothetical protein